MGTFEVTATFFKALCLRADEHRETGAPNVNCPFAVVQCLMELLKGPKRPTEDVALSRTLRALRAGHDATGAFCCGVPRRAFVPRLLAADVGAGFRL